VSDCGQSQRGQTGRSRSAVVTEQIFGSQCGPVKYAISKLLKLHHTEGMVNVMLQML